MSQEQAIDLKKKRIKAYILFAVSLLISVVLTWLLKEPGFSDSQVYTLFLLFFAIGLWITEAIPAFAVSLFILAFLVYAMGNKYINSEPEKIDKYVNTFSSSTIWLFLGGFFLSAALTKTKLDKELLKITLKMSGTNPRNILIAVMFTTMVGTMMMSSTATSSMVIASILPLLNELGKTKVSKALVLGVSIAATTGGFATIISSSSNVVAAGILEKAGFDIDFLTWMVYGAPITFILTAICCWVLIKTYIKDSRPVSMAFLQVDEDEKNVVHRIIVLFVISLTVLLWLTTSFHGITVAAVSAIPIVFLTLSGVLTGKDMRKLPWDTLLLVAGGLSLGVALQSTGILNHYALKVKEFSLGTISMLLILAYVASLLANVMSNSAAAIVLIPFGMAILPGMEVQISIAIGIASSMAILFTVSTTPNAIAYSTGMIDQKDFRYGGLIVGLLGPLLAVIWVLFVYALRH